MDRNTWFAGWTLLFLILMLAPYAQGKEFEAEITRVERGDLLTVLHEGEEIELTLYGITCPSPNQPHGNEARQFTARMTVQERVLVQVHRWESETSLVGTVLLSDGSILNHKLIRNGLAMWDRDAAPNDIKLQNLEDFARKLHLGLWAPPPEATHTPPAEEEQRPVAPTPTKPTLWPAILSTTLALLALFAVVTFFLLRFRDARDERRLAPPPVPDTAPAGDQPSQEEAEAVESGRRAVEELLQSLSALISGLVQTNTSYDSRMKDHQASVDEAMTMAGLEEIKRLLSREIEEMQSTSENYRRQLEHANATIREQQEILERFRIDAKMDFLTKIANRRAFQARLKEEFERTKRYKSVFTLIMIDIDHFKKVNDVHGHTAGDQILRLVAQVLEKETRFNDFVSRYGGEEFAVLLPESTIDQGRYVADKVRKAVENTSLLHENTKIKVTVSAGVGQVKATTDTPETFVGRVDAALYQAKASGRNRVETALD
jgi:diguanylate cyclase (GGDEF)-like protein